MQHGKENESVAKQKFFDYMTYILKQNFMIPKTGLVICSNSPDMNGRLPISKHDFRPPAKFENLPLFKNKSKELHY